MMFKYSAFVFWLFSLILACIYLFMNGFLLNRDALSDRSVCKINSECPDDNSRVIILLIDALRHDFMEWKDDDNNNTQYLNKMRNIGEIVKNQPNNVRQYKFIADPPTTTLQRLKALTTGSLPTFIDIGSNFGTPEINEDNLIDQLNAKNKGVVMLGDDTWSQLYKGRFLRETPFPSLNVWDIDTVDDGVIAGLDTELNNTDWNLLIGHFLGVDHIGHTYGPHHPLMAMKLIQMDQLIWYVIKKMDHNTVLFVFGDHGMTESGDHGGSSIPEITSALFIYSHNNTLVSFFEDKDTIDQIDIVPTLSQLLGVPIPFSNLGTSFLWRKPNTKEYFRNNAKQVYSYILKYSETNNLFMNEMDKLIKEFELLETKFSSDYPQYEENVINYIKNVQVLCRSHWIQFRLPLMIYSVTLLFAIIVIIVFLTFICCSFDEFGFIIENNFLIGAYSIYIIGVLMDYLIFKIAHDHVLGCILVTSLSLFYFIYMAINYLRTVDYLCLFQSFHFYNFIFAVIFHLLSLLALFSNSYVIYEQYVTYYLLLTITLVISQPTLNPKLFWERLMNGTFSYVMGHLYLKRVVITLLYTVILKLSSYFWMCREEHSSECRVNKDNPMWLTLISILSIASFLCGINKLLLRSTWENMKISFLCLILIISSWLVKLIDVECQSCGTEKLKFLLPLVSLAINVGVFIWSTLKCVILLQTYNQQATLIRSRQRPSNENEESLFFDISAEIVQIIISSLLVLVIILGGSRAVTLILCVTSLYIYSYLSSSRPFFSQGLDNQLFWFLCTGWTLSSWHWFYATGHQATFPNIRWNVVELTGNYFGGLVVLMELFSSHIIHSFIMPLLLILHSKSERKNIDRKERFDNCLLSGKLLCYVGYQSSRVLVSMLSALIHRRHLMVWKIFAPKLIFESVAFIFSIPFVTLGFMITDMFLSITL